MLLSAAVFSPVPCCQLHVINNDAREELPRAAGRVVPRVYQPNKVAGDPDQKKPFCLDFVLIVLISRFMLPF